MIMTIMKIEGVVMTRNETTLMKDTNIEIKVHNRITKEIKVTTEVIEKSQILKIEIIIKVTPENRV